MMTSERNSVTGIFEAASERNTNNLQMLDAPL